MNLETIVVVAGALGALGGLTGLAALLNSLTKAQDSSVQRLQGVIDALVKENGRIRTRISKLEVKSKSQSKKISCLEDKVEHWKDKYFSLCDWVQEGLGLEPFEKIDEE